ncbi:Hypothetical protein AA314_04117 [Archangium gephyra]|uniref:Uncharacterized protein n=1 Tax=Archangium gephyra TaxID=48 RepID=A0AAC8TFE8_9BACT|nr:Hypothetical protein AA314_04117 [Archangium gephyra]
MSQGGAEAGGWRHGCIPAWRSGRGRAGLALSTGFEARWPGRL